MPKNHDHTWADAHITDHLYFDQGLKILVLALTQKCRICGKVKVGATYWIDQHRQQPVRTHSTPKDVRRLDLVDAEQEES